MPRHAKGGDNQTKLPASTPENVRNILRSWSARLPQALAIGFGLARADEDCAARLRAAQIAAIVRLTPLAMVRNYGAFGEEQAPSCRDQRQRSVRCPNRMI
jgi:hypothetical protein